MWCVLAVVKYFYKNKIRKNSAQTVLQMLRDAILSSCVGITFTYFELVVCCACAVFCACGSAGAWVVRSSSSVKVVLSGREEESAPTFANSTRDKKSYCLPILLLSSFEFSNTETTRKHSIVV